MLIGLAGKVPAMDSEGGEPGESQFDRDVRVIPGGSVESRVRVPGGSVGRHGDEAGRF